MNDLNRVAPHGVGEVRAGLTGTLTNFLSRYPLESPDRLFQEAGLEQEKLGDGEATHRLSACLAFLELAARETGDECFGVGYAAHVPWKDLGILGYLMLHSPTMGSALENACRYFAVLQTLGQVSFSRGPQTTVVTYSLEHPDLGPAGQDVEMVLFLIVRFCREATGNPGWAPTQVNFTHAGPSGGSRHERYFGCPVRFGRHENSLVLHSSDLQRPIQKADAGLLPILLRIAEESLPKKKITGSYVDDVRRVVTESLSSGDVSIEEIAAQLETSARSLQRRLRDSGLTYQQLLGETRMALSQRYLEDPSLSLTETAFMLGYSDLSAFSRAFRRWTGRSPLAYRRNKD